MQKLDIMVVVVRDEYDHFYRFRGGKIEGMKVIKRNGTEENFESAKIENAVLAAFKATDPDNDKAEKYAHSIGEETYNHFLSFGREVHVEEIQDFVEDQLLNLKLYNIAKAYIRYRYLHELKRNTIDDKVLSLLDLSNEEIKQENSNKNPTIASTQRDYMAGEVSKDLAKRFLLPEKIWKAHEEGLIHFHDSDYFAQKIMNCALINLEDMLQNGTVISGTMIEKPHSFSTACNIATQIIAQVASNQYGLMTAVL